MGHMDPSYVFWKDSVSRNVALGLTFHLKISYEKVGGADIQAPLNDRSCSL